MVELPRETRASFLLLTFLFKRKVSRVLSRVPLASPVSPINSNLKLLNKKRRRWATYCKAGRPTKFAHLGK